MESLLIIFTMMKRKPLSNHIEHNTTITKIRQFYAPEIKDRGHIVFVLSVILSFCPPFWNFNLATYNNFWTVSARALIFHIFTLWPWPWSLTHFFENFNFANNFWTVSARALMFLVTRSSYWYQDICTWDLGHLGNWPLSGVIVFYKHILLRFAKRDKKVLYM